MACDAGEDAGALQVRSADGAEPLQVLQEGPGSMQSAIEPKLYRLLSSVPEVRTQPQAWWGSGVFKCWKAGRHGRQCLRSCEVGFLMTGVVANSDEVME
jgi:hypothetical protein